MQIIVVGSTFSGICLSASVCLFFHTVSKTAAAKITKLDIEMFHHESWKPVFIGQKVRGQGHKAQCQCGFICTPVSASYF